jgi:hypothetical protein
MEPFTYKGIWWTPEDPQWKVQGTLFFSPNSGADLELAGGLRSIEAPTILLGALADNTPITLHQCLQGRTDNRISGVTTSRYIYLYVYIGVHFEVEDQITFDKINVRFSYLDEWVDFPGFRSEYVEEDKGFVIKYQQVDPIECILSNNYKIKIGAAVIKPDDYSVSKREVVAKQKSFIQIDTGQKTPINIFHYYIQSLRNFLTLAASLPTDVTDMSGKIYIDENKNEFDAVRVKIYYYQQNNINVLSSIDKRKMLFSMSQPVGKISSLIRNWFDVYNKIESVFDLYFYTLYSSLSHELEFLLLAQALETFHRNVIKGSYETQESFMANTYPKITTGIPGNLDKDYKDGLRGKMKYMYEYSLRKRISDILFKYLSNIYDTSNKQK